MEKFMSFLNSKYIKWSVIPMAVILIFGYATIYNLYYRFAGADGTPEVPDFLEEKIENKSVVDGKININTADLKTLMLIEGIGEDLANKIISKREEIGGFKTIDDIRLVKGIGSGIFRRISNCIIVTY